MNPQVSQEREKNSFFENSHRVKELIPSDFTEGFNLKKSKDLIGTRSAVMFYAPWCGHCKRFRPVWESLYRINGCMRLCAFNCEKYREFHMAMMKTTNAITGFPTIAFYVEDRLIQTYQGPRDPPDELVKSMLLFCQEHPLGEHQTDIIDIQQR